MSLRRSSAWIGLGVLLAHPGAALPSEFQRRAQQQVEVLARLGPRIAGTVQERKAADFIIGQLMAMGIPAVVEPFRFESFELSDVQLRIGDQVLRPSGLDLDPYASAAAPGRHSGEFVVLETADPSSWPISIKGAIVLVARTADPDFHLRLAALEPRFVVHLTARDMARVQASGQRTLELRFPGRLHTGQSQNVVAHLGAPEPAPQIVLAAHLDAYRRGAGASDNATGVAALLELARHFKQAGVPGGVGITFLAFGAGELGALGARHYVVRHARSLPSVALTLGFHDLGGKRPVQVERDGGRQSRPANPGQSQIPRTYLTRAWEGSQFPWRLIPPPALLNAFSAPYHPPWLTEAIDAAVGDLAFDVRFTGLQDSDQRAFAQAGVATSGISAPSDRRRAHDDLPSTVDFERVEECTEAARLIVSRAIDHLANGGRGASSAPR